MKVLLIRPDPPKETIGLKHVMICEPLELEYLIANVPKDIKDKVDLKIYDFILEKRPFKKVLLDERPDFIVFTGYITHVGLIKEMAQEAKGLIRHIKVGVGGVHAEVLPEDFQSEYIDFIYDKNGIDAFNETLLGLLVDRTEEDINWKIRTKISEKSTVFNYKHPDRKAVEAYRKDYYYMFHNPCALIKTSFGCPYNCSFCFCRKITDGAYFTRDMEDVLDELESIEEKEIYIVDDDFLIDKNRLRQFIDGVRTRNIDKNYLIYGRADFITENKELMKELKDVGLQAVIVGIESLRAKDLNDYEKGTSKEINEKCISILKELDIELYATMIMPMDFTKQDFRDLRNWLRSMDVRFVNLQPLTPLPGTDIFDEYKPYIIVEREDYGKWDMAHIILRPENMSIRKFYFQILYTYYRVVMRTKHRQVLVNKYGSEAVKKMIKGSMYVSRQYIKKIILGR